MYSTFLGIEAVVPAFKAFLGDHQCDDWTNQEEVMALLDASSEYGIVTTPIHDQVARLKLKNNEILIVEKKHKDMYRAMIEYGLIQPLQKTASCGGWGDIPLCRIIFPFDTDRRPGGKMNNKADIMEFLQSQRPKAFNPFG